MSEAQFSLIFRGPAVDNGEIDVQDLAPALLAVGDLIQAANNSINAERAKATVKVRATAEGSFEIDLSLVQSVVDTVTSILDFAGDHRGEIAAANDLADLIFKVGVPAGGLLMLLKWLKGRRPERIEEKGGDVILHVGDNYFLANRKTIQLAEDLNVRRHAKRLVSVLEREGIKSFASRQQDEEELLIERRDISAFAIPETEETELVDEVREMNLQIISLSFKEDNKWKLTDGAEPFSARIEDVDFINQISRNQISFAKNDYLRCLVRERQVQTSQGLKKELTIVEVIEHKPAPRQLRLI